MRTVGSSVPRAAPYRKAIAIYRLLYGGRMLARRYLVIERERATGCSHLNVVATRAEARARVRALTRHRTRISAGVVDLRTASDG